MTQAQIPKRVPLTFQREEGKAPGTVIFRFSGPFTVRALYASQSPDVVDKMFGLQSMLPSGELPTVNIFDLTGVPYMDSAGLGMVVRHYARCQDKGVRFIAAGMSRRVMDLFEITKVDTILPLIATVEEADTQ